ncbi:PucR family transcriptional regulator [Cohnella nanjingensis]|uniref:PucR family transcriptional regulator n=1 Tax=Cohnella nanjingensis TaxID=1387779 RepID=A0A7X0RME9_9BACL|nr:helix-turn-helix domain-containing protein [Cohnella nanjingensis]MBB6670157.1 PucR family transcriptional regulator [Cohnella nanjingensis]
MTEPTENNPFAQSFDSLETLAETINEVLGCPVTIEDAGHRLLAYSAHDPHTDSARLATIVGRRVPENVIASLRRDGVIQRLADSLEPIRVPAIDEVGFSGRLAIAIRHKDAVLGYLWLLESGKTLGGRELALFKQAARAAADKMVRLQSARRKSREGLRDFMWMLLHGQFGSEAPIRDKAEQLGLALPAEWHVVVVQAAGAIDERAEQRLLDRVSASRSVRPVLHAVDRAQAILLCAPQLAGADRRAYAREAQAFFARLARGEEDGVPAAVGSSAFGQSYAETPARHREALAVLQTKRLFPRETERAFYYPDLGYYRFLPAIAAQSRAEVFRNESLVRLRAYDREHDANLLSTLATFLAHDSNAKTAAEALHVHSNTLSYRLKRIAEIGGIDLTDMDQKVSLYLALKAERLATDQKG